MKKTFAIIYFIACFILLSLNVGSSAFKYELLSKGQTYAAKEIPPGNVKSPSSGAAYNKTITQKDSVSDIDGNVYHIVKIGKQRWTQENLKTHHFSNGDTIPEMEYNIDWPKPLGPAWCYYERYPPNNHPYGKLYNWYAVADPRNVCPVGWHVPSDSDFQVLSDYLGGDDIAGTHMKAIDLWNEKDQKYADNTSGFTALPAGIRYASGSFARGGADGADFWTSSVNRTYNSICRVLYFGGSNLGRHSYDRRGGFSVRCVGN